MVPSDWNLSLQQGQKIASVKAKAPGEKYTMPEKSMRPFEFSNTLKAEGNQKVFETPIKIRRDDSSAHYNYQSTSSFPTFIHKKEVIKSENENPLDSSMKISVNSDIMEFTAQFDNASDKKEKVNILINGKKRLNDEAQKLSLQASNDLRELLFAKEYINY